MTIVTSIETDQERQAATQNNMSSGESTDAPLTMTRRPEVQQEEDPVDDLSPLFADTPFKLPISLESVERAELIRL